MHWAGDLSSDRCAGQPLWNEASAAWPSMVGPRAALSSSHSPKGASASCLWALVQALSTAKPSHGSCLCLLSFLRFSSAATSYRKSSLIS